jgi:hypothetical protein
MVTQGRRRKYPSGGLRHCSGSMPRYRTYAGGGGMPNPQAAATGPSRFIAVGVSLLRSDRIHELEKHPMNAEQVVPAPHQRRVSGPNRYPNFDLENCLAFARAVKEQGGNACTADQIGGLLGYRNVRAGGFIARVAATRLFGLITTVEGRYRTTPLGETILYPVTPEQKRQALSEAFLNVPLYRTIYEEFRGIRLPEALGLDNLLRTKFQIPAGERTALARRVLLDSADQAGFFSATQGQRTNLIDPVMGMASSAPSASPWPQAAFAGGDGGGGVSAQGPATREPARTPIGDAKLTNVPPELYGLLTSLPEPGEEWPRREMWQKLWKDAMDYVYGELPPTKD